MFDRPSSRPTPPPIAAAQLTRSRWMQPIASIWYMVLYHIFYPFMRAVTRLECLIFHTVPSDYMWHYFSPSGSNWEWPILERGVACLPLFILYLYTVEILARRYSPESQEQRVERSKSNGPDVKPIRPPASLWDLKWVVLGLLVWWAFVILVNCFLFSITPQGRDKYWALLTLRKFKQLMMFIEIESGMGRSKFDEAAARECC